MRKAIILTAFLNTLFVSGVEAQMTSADIPASELLKKILASSSPGGADWPKMVLLQDAVTFPAVIDGHAVGSVRIPAGTSVTLVSFHEGNVQVEYQGARATIAAASCDLIERVLAARKLTAVAAAPSAAMVQGSVPVANPAPLVNNAAAPARALVLSSAMPAPSEAQLISSPPTNAASPPSGAAAPKAASTPEPLPANIEKFIVKTRSPENSEVPFYLRIPKAYQTQAPGSQKLYRVLFFCPAINFDGLHKMLKDVDFLALADERGWFMLAPTFHQNGSEAHDRKLSYYYPETFSGQAVLDALDHFKQKYPIATYGLLLHGFSGGAQFVHRFAIWAPERVAAVAAHTSSWFDDPTPACSQVAWLVTVGEADPSADNTYDFVAKLRQAGAVPLLRSYIGIGHTRSYRVPKLEYEFLKYYDDLTRDKMATESPVASSLPSAPLAAAAMPYVGDNEESRYYTNTPDHVENIAEDDRVYLPSEAIAKEWLAPAQDDAQ